MGGRKMNPLAAGLLIGAVAAALIPLQQASGQVLRARKQATLVADNMTGDQVVPGPGDPDGFGTASLPNDSEAGRICWDINTENIEVPLSGALIHVGSAGEKGQVVAQLFADNPDPDPSGCKTEDSQTLRDLNQNSQEYYLEINNFDFTEGAIRGQLHLEKF